MMPITPIQISPDDVTNWFDVNTMSKAIAYLNKVSQFVWHTDHTVTARVKGSGNQYYRQQLTFGLKSDNTPYLKANDCSCPVGKKCKHVAAVAMKLASKNLTKQSQLKPENKQQQEIDSYFSELYTYAKKELEKEPPPLAPGKEHLLWLISAENFPFSHAVFILQPVRIKRLLSGAWSSKMTEVSNAARWLQGYSTPAYLSYFDLEMTELIVNNDLNSTYSDGYEIGGEPGFLILNKLVNSGRLLWLETINKQRHSYQLAAEPSMPLPLSWETQANQWALTHQLNRLFDQVTLIPTKPIMLLGKKGDKFSMRPLETDLPIDIIEHLAKKPIYIPQETLFDRWQTFYGFYHTLPKLPDAAMSHIETHPAQPILTIGYLTQHNNLTKTTEPLLAGLTFRYHDFEFLPEVNAVDDGIPTIQPIIDKTGKKRLLQRDIKLEKNAEETLTTLALTRWVGQDEKNNLWMPLSARQKQTPHITPIDWLPLLDGISALQAEGWEVILQEPSLNNIERTSDLRVTLSDDQQDYTLAAQLHTEAGELPILGILLEWLEQGRKLPEKGHIWLQNPLSGKFIAVPVEVLKPVLQAVTELYDRPLSETGNLKLTQFDVMGLSQQAIVKMQSERASRIRQTVSQLAQVKGIQHIEPPQGLQANLRHYQQEGLNWIHFLTEHQLGGVLADDMGLGKTIQIIAYLLKQKELGKLTKPVLVISPTSVVGNWNAELNKFAPTLTTLRFDGAQRKAQQKQINTTDVILTSYALLQRDVELWRDIPLHSIILDEAQYAKNTQTKTAQAIRELKSDHKLCLTGTPLENNLGELWSLFDFVMPGFLNTTERFKKLYRTPIEERGDTECQQRLGQRVSPFMLRRTKAEVVTELPPKTEIIQRVTLEKDQAQLYASVRIAMQKRVQELMSEKGLKRSHIEILDALLKLRQVCCDPRLLKIPAAEKVKHSAKLETLLDMVQEMLPEGRKILIFSQFSTMLGLIESALANLNIRTSKLTGQTRDRQGAIDRFTQGEADVFLISLKAGGVGLNLTTADTVIHYDPWWNPAAESQATDRAYRIGQDKPVFVYKLIVEETVEEKILIMQEKKRALADSLFGDQDALSVWTDGDMILSLFSENTEEEKA